MDISHTETTLSSTTKLNLELAELLLGLGSGALEEEALKLAKPVLNATAASNNHLARLYWRRRGQPRKDLTLKIRYYGIWQRALVGVLEEANGNAVGTGLLKKAQMDASNLVRDYPDRSEFQELLQKVTGWVRR